MATIVLDSCSQDDLEAVIYTCDPGTKIVLPAGSSTWGNSGRANAGKIYIDREVTIVGQGDSTIITLDDSGAQYAEGVINIWAKASISKIKFIGSNVNPVTLFSVSPYDGPHGNFDGGFRVFDITYDGRNGNGYFLYHNAGIFDGLIYGCRFPASAGQAELIGGRGRANSWQTAHSLGGAENIFIEDNTFGGSGYVCDANANARYVVRYNQIGGANKIDAHGVASNSPPRSARHMEIYRNDWTKETGNHADVEHRGGGLIAFENTSLTGLFLLHDYAYDAEPGPWPNYGLAATMAFGNPTTAITTTVPHGWETGYPVWVQGTGSIEEGEQGNIYGSYEITVTGANSFTIPLVTIGNITLDFVGVYKTPEDYPLPDQLGNGQDGEDREPGYVIGNRQADAPWAREIKPACASAIEFYKAQTDNPSATFDDADIIRSSRDFFSDAGFDANVGAFRGTYEEMMAMDEGDLEEGFGFLVTNRGSWDLLLPVNESGGLIYRWDGAEWQLHYTPYQYPHPLRPVARIVALTEGPVIPAVVTEPFEVLVDFNGATATLVCTTEGNVQPAVVTEEFIILDEFYGDGDSGIGVGSVSGIAIVSIAAFSGIARATIRSASGILLESTTEEIEFLRAADFGGSDQQSFSRAIAAGYSGTADADPFQREAAVDVLRDSHFVDGVQSVLLEDEPTPCAVVAPGVPAVTPDGLDFSATFTAIPVTVSRLRYEYRLDNTGGWTSNGTSLTINATGTAGTHTLQVRAVSTSGVPGEESTSASFDLESLTVTFVDTFDRSDSSPLSNPPAGTWESGPGAFTGVQIVSNESRSIGGSPSASRVTTPAFPERQAATITISAGAFKNQCGPMVRMVAPGSGSGYLGYIDSVNLVAIYKITDTGSLGFGFLASQAVTTLVAGDTVTIAATGTGTVNLEMLVNGVSVLTISDSSTPFDSGQPGQYFGNDNVNIAEFSAEEVLTSISPEFLIGNEINNWFVITITIPDELTNGYVVFSVAYEFAGVGTEAATFDGTPMDELEVSGTGGRTVKVFGLEVGSLVAGDYDVALDATTFSRNISVCVFNNVNQTTSTGTVETGSGFMDTINPTVESGASDLALLTVFSQAQVITSEGDVLSAIGPGAGYLEVSSKLGESPDVTIGATTAAANNVAFIAFVLKAV